jgi:hypothetical protein
VFWVESTEVVKILGEGWGAIVDSGKVESTKDNLKGVMTMAHNSMAFLEALGNSGGEDFFLKA